MRSTAAVLALAAAAFAEPAIAANLEGTYAVTLSRRCQIIVGINTLHPDGTGGVIGIGSQPNNDMSEMIGTLALTPDAADPSKGRLVGTIDEVRGSAIRMGRSGQSGLDGEALISQRERVNLRYVTTVARVIVGGISYKAVFQDVDPVTNVARRAYLLGIEDGNCIVRINLQRSAPAP